MARKGNSGLAMTWPRARWAVLPVWAKCVLAVYMIGFTDGTGDHALWMTHGGIHAYAQAYPQVPIQVFFVSLIALDPLCVVLVGFVRSPLPGGRPSGVVRHPEEGHTPKMKRVIGLGIGGLLALVVGLVLPHLADSAVLHARTGDKSFQGTAAFCIQALHPTPGLKVDPSTVRQYDLALRVCGGASDVMSLGAWLVVLGALALVAAVIVLALGRMRRRPALRPHAV